MIIYSLIVRIYQNTLVALLIIYIVKFHQTVFRDSEATFTTFVQRYPGKYLKIGDDRGGMNQDAALSCSAVSIIKPIHPETVPKMCRANA